MNCRCSLLRITPEVRLRVAAHDAQATRNTPLRDWWRRKDGLWCWLMLVMLPYCLTLAAVMLVLWVRG